MSDDKKREVGRLGHSKIFTPEVIDDIHIKAELGRYRMRGFSMFKKVPGFDDLTFLPGTPTHRDCSRHCFRWTAWIRQACSIT